MSRSSRTRTQHAQESRRLAGCRVPRCQLLRLLRQAWCARYLSRTGNTRKPCKIMHAAAFLRGLKRRRKLAHRLERGVAMSPSAPRKGASLRAAAAPRADAGSHTQHQLRSPSNRRVPAVRRQARHHSRSPSNRGVPAVARQQTLSDPGAPQRSRSKRVSFVPSSSRSRSRRRERSRSSCPSSSRSRSTQRCQRDAGIGGAVRWLASSHRQYAVLCVDGDNSRRKCCKEHSARRTTR